MYAFLDIFFIVIHSCFVLFNLTGWIWSKTRRAHLLTIGLTFLSWFGLGIWYGWGYCPFTDWHWKVKLKLGETDLPNSYIKYYIDHITNSSWDPLVVDAVTMVFALLVFILSCVFSWKDYRSHRNV